MTNEVNKILSHTAREVVKSPELLLLMLRTYSKLYLSGGAPNTCESCHYRYYTELSKDGIMKAALQEKITNRTLKPAFTGMKRLNLGTHIAHVQADLLFDEKAIKLLNFGALNESDFEVLPVGYKKKRKKRAPKKSQ